MKGEGKVLSDATNKLHVGSGNLKGLKSKGKKSKKSENLKPMREDQAVQIKHGILTDPPITTTLKTKTFSDQAMQTDLCKSEYCNSFLNNEDSTENTIAILTSEKTPCKYWERLAEKRRQALEISIEENEALREENEMLKRDIKAMEEILEDAKVMALIVQEHNLIDKLYESDCADAKDSGSKEDH